MREWALTDLSGESLNLGFIANDDLAQGELLDGDLGFGALWEGIKGLDLPLTAFEGEDRIVAASDTG